MGLIAVCAVLFVAGILLVLRWGGLDVRSPREPGGVPRNGTPPSPPEVARHYLWNVTLAVVSGVGAGVLVAGAGGRLAMRLLAVTAGDAAQGAVTEADQVVGRVTVGGSVGFVVFTGLFFGLVSGAGYVAVRRWLPSGRLGGLTYGALLLVVAGPRIDPLRPDNPDFEIVGPAWVSLTVLGGLVVLHGTAVAAIAARYSRLLPLAGPERRAIVAHLPLLVLLPAAPVALMVAVAGVVVVGLTRVPGLVAAARSPVVTLAGRVAVALAVAVALPGFVTAVADIAAARA